MRHLGALINHGILDHVTMYDSAGLYQTAVGIQFDCDSCFVRLREYRFALISQKVFEDAYLRKIVTSELTWVPPTTE
jgi:hypothetical protein